MPICLSIVGYIIIYSTSLKLLGNFQPLLVFILRLSQNFFRRNVISQLGNYNYKHNNLTRFTMLFKLLTKIHYRKQGVYKDQLWKFIRQNYFLKKLKINNVTFCDTIPCEHLPDEHIIIVKPVLDASYCSV